MATSSRQFLVLLYWDRSTWYSITPIASSLDTKGIPYEIIKGDPVPIIKEKLRETSMVIYGESSRSMLYQEMKSRLSNIRNQFSKSEVTIVIGGPHASGAPERVLEIGADYVIIGEGEESFPRLIRAIESRKLNNQFDLIPNIAFCNQINEIKLTQPTSPINLDDYSPYSDNSLFPLHPPIELMRGCAFRCRFCQVGYIYGNPRFRSIKNIVKVVEHYFNHFKPLKDQVDIRFIAPNSLGYMERKRGHPNFPALSELLNALSQFDIRIFFGTFPSEVRPEYITEETVSLFDLTHNDQISVGFQSGSDRVLKDMRRGHNVEDGLIALNILSDHGYTPIFDFILGNPNESLDEQWETLNLVREMGNKAKARLHYFMPLPGTPWAELTPTPLPIEIHAEIGRLAKAEIVMGELTSQMEYSSGQSD